MKKALKILINLLFLTVIIFFNINVVNGVDLNLTENTSENSSSSYANTNSSYSNSSRSNSVTTQNSSTNYNSTTIPNSSTTVSNTHSTDFDLSLTNILNIFLIVIGILLIL